MMRCGHSPVSRDKEIRMYKSLWLTKVGSALSITPVGRGRVSFLIVEIILI